MSKFQQNQLVEIAAQLTVKLSLQNIMLVYFYQLLNNAFKSNAKRALII